MTMSYCLLMAVLVLRVLSPDGEVLHVNLQYNKSTEACAREAAEAQLKTQGGLRVVARCYAVPPSERELFVWHEEEA